MERVRRTVGMFSSTASMSLMIASLPSSGVVSCEAAKLGPHTTRQSNASETGTVADRLS